MQISEKNNQKNKTMQRQRNQNRVKPRIATIPKGKSKNVKRVLHFQVDDDQTSNVMQDAVFGPIRRNEGYERDTLSRPKATDIQVAGVHVAHTAYKRALGQGADSVLPSSWTQGYALPGTFAGNTVDGQAPAEGQWDLDPSALAVIDASYHRTVEQARARSDKSGEAVLMEAYARANEFMRKMIQAARKRKYAFEPRGAEGIQRRKVQAGVLPWARSVYYELAVRGLDRLWEALDITRQLTPDRKSVV